MKRISGTVALLALAACETDESPETKPPVPAPVTFASGSRLRAVFHEIDGVKLFVGWQDAQLGKPCAFLDGRCLPGTTRVEQERLALFDDDACTSRVAMMAEDSAFGGEFDQIAFVEGSAACPEIVLHVRGERVMPDRVFMRNADGTCEEVGSGGDVVRVGPALGPDDATFVRAKEENGPGSGRIVPRWRVADDGAREIIGAWDTERNEAVTTFGPTSGKRWLPSEIATPVGEDRCPGVATSFACEPTAAFIGGDGCRDPEIFALGPPVDTATCSQTAGGAYSMASKVPAASFAAATRVEVGSGRVRLEMSAAGDPILPRVFVDTEARAACAVTELAGVLRCQPALDARATEAFSDEACTQKAIVWRPSSAACDASPDVPRYLSFFDGGLVEVGAQINGAWTSSGAGCTSVPLTDGAAAYVVSPLDASRLPTAVLKTE